jgi:large subunit ribosomal protein L1
LFDNLAALMNAIKKAKPQAAKGTYIKHVTITSTMGPGIKLDILAAQSMTDVVE